MNVKRFRSVLLLVVLLTWSVDTLSASALPSAEKFLKDARACAEEFDFKCAEQNYLNALREDPDNMDANREYGMLLNKYLNRKSEAIPFLEKALLKAEKRDSLPETLFALATSYHYVSRFSDAKKHYALVIPACKNTKAGDQLKTSLLKYMEQCDFANSYVVPDENNMVINLGDAVNGPGPEYVPVYLAQDSSILFTARRISAHDGLVDGKDGKYYEEIYRASKTENGITSPEIIHPEGDASILAHESVVSVSPDGKTVFLAINGKLYSADYTNGKLGKSKDLGKNINRGKYQNHAVVSADGKTLFFSSISKDGEGGLDIFRSELQSDGTWGPATSLGPDINTPDDEESPAISPDGKTLYFSSRGHRGFGGYDLFSAEWDGSKFTNVKNLGAPVNSPADDIYLTLNPDGKSGMFSSGRSNGMGDMDIYMLVFKDKVEPECNFQSPLAISGLDTLAPGAEAEYVYAGIPANASQLSFKWSTNSGEFSSEKISVKNASQSGSVAENIHLEASFMNGNTKEKWCAIKTVQHKTVTENSVVNTVTTSATVSLEAIYFDFDNFSLNEQARKAIARNLEILRNNPNLRISLAGFADSRGSASYNMVLSKRRLNAVFNFLIKMGIDRSRILISEAKGESQPVNRCTDGVECSEDEHAKNRRVEFIIAPEV